MEIKNVLNTTEKKLKALMVKLKELKNVVSETGLYGLRVGNIKAKELHYERIKTGLIFSIGRRTYKLFHQDKITDEETIRMCKKLKEIEEVARKYHGTERRLKPR